jgi:guanylate kinase
MLSEMKEMQAGEETGSAAEARGMLVVVSSPSGGGKGTLIRRALKTVPNLGYSVSFTTRLPREGERDGHDYHFVSVEEFQRMIDAGEFLEWAHVHGNLYGTGRSQVAREVAEGRDIILEIDTQGAKSVRSLVTDEVSIFILPPSYEVLRERLVGRGSEQPGELALRLRNARDEVEQYREFDYVVINDDADLAAAQLASIICAERARRERQERVARRVLASFPGA